MDYPFFIYKLGSLPPKLFNELQESLVQTNSFVLSEGFSPEYGVKRPDSISSNLYSCIESVKKELTQWFEHDKIKSHSINLLSANHNINEHSDLDGINHHTTAFDRCIINHIIHIPITNSKNVKYLHRRTRSINSFESSMELGGIYLFNNYVLHSVLNQNETDRINLCFTVEDSRHETKIKLLKSLNITTGNFFELRF